MSGINDQFVGLAPDMGAEEFDPNPSAVGAEDETDPTAREGEDAPARERSPIAHVRIVPNPARGPAEIRCAMTQAGPVEAAIFDPSGRLVRELRVASQPAGPQFLVWDGRDRHGIGVPAGVYCLRIGNGPGAISERIVRLP
jgi:hypothetical protein